MQRRFHIARRQQGLRVFGVGRGNVFAFRESGDAGAFGDARAPGAAGE
jgi:hypothetical protein